MRKKVLAVVMVCMVSILLVSCIGITKLVDNSPEKKVTEKSPFTKQEIKDAREVIMNYFKATNTNDIESYNQCVVRTRIVEPGSDIHYGANREVKKIRLNTNPNMREEIILYNSPEERYFPSENVIVFEADFDLSFDSKEDEKNYTMPVGLVEKYYYTLVREKKDGPWMINEWGY